MKQSFSSYSIFAYSTVLISLLQFSAVPAYAEFSQKLSKATELLNNGRPKSAVGILKSVVASQPDNAQAHMILGAALASLVDNDDYDAAIQEEQLALKLDPDSYGARRILGQIYTNQKKTEEAVTILREASAINPESYAAHRNLGIALTSAGKTDEAILALKKAAQLKPDRSEAHVKLSALELKREHYKEAITEAKKAIKLDVSNPEAHLALANALLASGEKIASIEYYEEALQANWSKRYRNPLTAANAYSGLGWAFSINKADKKKIDEAISYQRQAIKIFPPFGPAYVRLAELLGLEGKLKEADSIYQSSIKLSQEDAGVSVAYAKFLAKTGRQDQARLVLKKVLDKTPDCKQASDTLADLDNEIAS